MAYTALDLAPFDRVLYGNIAAYYGIRRIDRSTPPPLVVSPPYKCRYCGNKYTTLQERSCPTCGGQWE